MKSIRTQFIVLVLAAIALSIVIVGSISAYVLVSKSDSDSSTILSLTCERETQQLNVNLKRIEESVMVNASYAVSSLDSYKKFAEDKAFRKSYTKDMEELFGDVANETPGAVAFSYAYDTDLESGSLGFFCRRVSLDGEFELMEIDGDANKVENRSGSIGDWYTVPKETGEPAWLAPHMNEGLGSYTTTYVTPVYVDDRFVGVAGMDMDFGDVIEQVSEIKMLDGSYAYLCSEDGEVYYHPAMSFGTNLFDDDDELPEVDAAIREGDSRNLLVPYSYQGTDKLLAVRTMENGMRLVITVDAANVYAERNQLVLFLGVAMLVIALVFVGLGLLSIRRLLRPLKQLTESARQVADGNLDVEILSSDTEELSSLVDSYQRTVATLKDQMAIVDEIAHRDGLTGMLNTSSYNEAAARLDAQIAAGEARFALAMLDLNDLKGINDTYGHECGDEYLKTAAAQIGRSFEGHQAFRIGGDEFVVLLEGEGAAQDAERCLQDIEAAMEESAVQGLEPWWTVSLACGAACFDAEHDERTADVFKRADAAMYARKQQMKAAR